jgi:hypothetical protein
LQSAFHYGSGSKRNHLIKYKSIHLKENEFYEDLRRNRCINCAFLSQNGSMDLDHDDGSSSGGGGGGDCDSNGTF